MNKKYKESLHFLAFKIRTRCGVIANRLVNNTIENAELRCAAGETRLGGSEGCVTGKSCHIRRRRYR